MSLSRQGGSGNRSRCEARPWISTDLFTQEPFCSCRLHEAGPREGAGQGQFLCLILRRVAAGLFDGVFHSLCIPVDGVLDETVLPHAYCLRGGTDVARPMHKAPARARSPLVQSCGRLEGI